jgi:hypothetical protein
MANLQRCQLPLHVLVLQAELSHVGPQLAHLRAYAHGVACIPWNRTAHCIAARKTAQQAQRARQPWCLPRWPHTHAPSASAAPPPRSQPRPRRARRPPPSPDAPRRGAPETAARPHLPAAASAASPLRAPPAPCVCVCVCVCGSCSSHPPAAAAASPLRAPPARQPWGSSKRVWAVGQQHTEHSCVVGARARALPSAREHR